MTHEPLPTTWDVADPHHELHPGHVVVRPRVLVNVLAALLALTVLTVAASRLEVWVAETFQVAVLQSINVGVVLLIAAIKSALVAMYFMQLRYDSLVNTAVFLFCLFALALFLFFSMVDVGRRDAIYPWKSGEIQAGGSGVAVHRPMGGVDTRGMPLTAWRREERLIELAARGVPDPEARYRQEMAILTHHGHVPHEDDAGLSTPNRSRPRRGLTPGLFDPPAPVGRSGHGH